MGKLKLTDRQRRAVALTAAIATILLVADVGNIVRKHIAWRSWVKAGVPTTQPASQPSSGPASASPESKPSKSSQSATRSADSKSARSKGKSNRQPEINEALQKRNLFVAAKPPGHGLSLTGVLGRMAMFKSREGKPVTIEVGESSKGITLKAIDGCEVTIEFEGKPETIKLFAGGMPDMTVSGGMAMPPGMAMPTGPGGPQIIGGPGGPGMMPGGMDMSNIPPEIRKQMERMKRKSGN